jgi:hypothetical protein
MEQKPATRVVGQTDCPTTRPLLELYARAFSEYGVQCLWSWKPVSHPTPSHARVIARALRAEGNRAAWELSWEIEDACDAVEGSSPAVASDRSASTRME